MTAKEQGSDVDPISRFLDPERPLDCDEGRRLGCAGFCCCLVVRLKQGEADPGKPDATGPRCVEKHPGTGRCIYQNVEDSRCTVYAQRPEVCGSYDCRNDPLLTIVLEEGFRSIGQLVARHTQRIKFGIEP